MIKILELFGGIGAPRKALVNLGIDFKAIDYVEIDEKAVRTYNAMFEHDYHTQTVVDYNLKPDILIHGSPCQDISIAGHQKGANEGSETRSSLMWETIKIIRNFGVWKPEWVIWENVKGVLGKTMRPNFDRYLSEMNKLGYESTYAVLDARDFGLPQARKRVFTISSLNSRPFDFSRIERKPMQPISRFLQPNNQVSAVYKVTQPSVLNGIGQTGIKRATVIDKFVYTITTRQDRTPAQVVDCGGYYRYLTERECWRLQGFSDEDYDRASSVQKRNGRFKMALYNQSGNSIPVQVLEAIFKQIIQEMGI